MSRTLKPSLWVLGLVAVYGLAVLFRFHHVHAESGEWRDRPTAQPPRLGYHGHTYDRMATDAARRTGFSFHGAATGGGIILAPKHLPDPATIQVDYRRVYVSYRRAGS